MQKEHYKVEAATIAHSSGNLTYESWSHDVVLALGLSAVRNPIGFWLVRVFSESEPKAGPILELAHGLSEELKKKGIKSHDKSAKCAVAYVLDSRCPDCQGRGVTDFNQNTCKTCNGTGKRDTTSYHADIRAGIDVLLERIDWIELQLQLRLKGVDYLEPDGKKVNLPYLNSKHDLGFNRHPVTPSRIPNA